MQTLLGWSAILSLWCLVTVALTQWPKTELDLLRTTYVAIWAAWGWLPVSLAYASLRSARALRNFTKRTLNTTLPTWSVALADKSAIVILNYLDKQTFSLAERRQQADALVALWQPRTEQAYVWLNQPDVREIAEQWLPPTWWLYLRQLLDQPFPSTSIANIRQSTESWLAQLETSVKEVRQKSTQPLAQWLTEQSQQFLLGLHVQYIGPWARNVLWGYRVWLAALVLWALLPWAGWLIVAACL